jgi:hypothetical protein
VAGSIQFNLIKKELYCPNKVAFLNGNISFAAVVGLE